MLVRVSIHPFDHDSDDVLTLQRHIPDHYKYITLNRDKFIQLISGDIATALTRELELRASSAV